MRPSQVFILRGSSRNHFYFLLQLHHESSIIPSLCSLNVKSDLVYETHMAVSSTKRFELGLYFLVVTSLTPRMVESNDGIIIIFYSPFCLAHCLTFVSYLNRWRVCSFTVQDDIFCKVLSKLFFNWCDNNTTITYPFLSQTRRITPVLEKNLKLMLLMILLLVMTRRGYVTYKEVCVTWGEIAWL